MSTSRSRDASEWLSLWQVNFFVFVFYAILFLLLCSSWRLLRLISIWFFFFAAHRFFFFFICLCRILFVFVCLLFFCFGLRYLRHSSSSVSIAISVSVGVYLLWVQRCSPAAFTCARCTIRSPVGSYFSDDTRLQIWPAIILSICTVFYIVHILYLYEKFFYFFSILIWLLSLILISHGKII